MAACLYDRIMEKLNYIENNVKTGKFKIELYIEKDTDNVTVP